MATPKTKKELDRDMMFRKIMPALADNPFSIPVTDPNFVDPPQGEDEAPALEFAPQPAEEVPAPKRKKQRPKPEPAYSAPQPPSLKLEEDEEDDLSALSAKLFARAPQPAPAAARSATVNLMEGLVAKHLDEVMHRFNCCRCDRCRRDVAAGALNQLPARYVESGAKLTPTERESNKKMVLNALIKSVLQVRSYPSH